MGIFKRINTRDTIEETGLASTLIVDKDKGYYQGMTAEDDANLVRLSREAGELATVQDVIVNQGLQDLGEGK